MSDKSISPVTCLFGYDWLTYHVTATCPACQHETAEACARFQVAVAAGQFDAQGYTPAERRAQDKRAREAGRLLK